MGKQKYQEEIEGLFKKSPVVKFSSVERIVKYKRDVRQYCKQLIRGQIKKGKIKRLTKGCYTIHAEPSLAVFCFKPAYLGLQDALSFHELWEQETVPVIITSRKVRQGIRKILGMNVLIRRVNKRYLFGFNYEKQGDLFIPVSDIEKTFIDFVYFKERLGKETENNIKKKLNKKKLVEYLERYPQKLKIRVLKQLG